LTYVLLKEVSYAQHTVKKNPPYKTLN